MPRRILLITNCEYGQANVVLALAYELALRPQVCVSIASFPPLENRVAELQLRLQGARAALGGSNGSDSSPRITFHTLPGRRHLEAVGMTELNIPHGSGVREAIHSFRHVGSILFPWTEEEYTAQLRKIEEIIRDFQPDVVVAEQLLRAGQDVCQKMGVRLLIVTPNSGKDLVGFEQPWMAGFWRYPALSSGYPYPVPWSKMASNLYTNCQLIYSLTSSSIVKNADRIREEYLKSNSSARPTRPLLSGPDPEIQYLCPSTPDIDFPELTIPENVTLCGPMIMPTVSVYLADSGLAEWLDRGPTVLINLGTHVTMDASLVRELAGGLRIWLGNSSSDSRKQVLWKLRPEGDVQSVLDECIVDDVAAERIRIVQWLHAEPNAILEHPNVICSVHHGGANSTFEAIFTGVPQIILPVWYDTYEYAARVEWLGIGIWGSRNHAPKAEAREFGEALARVAGSESLGTSDERLSAGDGAGADEFRRKAKQLSDTCRRSPYTGRIRAADEVLSFAM